MTNLRDAMLTGVDLQGARGLTQEQLDAAICDDKTKPPPGLKNKRADADTTSGSSP
jgi:hypothetical protein